MPGKTLAKIIRIGYVGQVITAGLLLTMAVLLMFAVIGALEPVEKPPAAKITQAAEGQEQEQVLAANYRLEEPNDAGQVANQIVEKNTAVNTELVTAGSKTVDNELITQLWSGKLTKEFGWQFYPLYQDWRYHNGIDISGDEGQLVPALAAGQIVEIYNDKQYGLTVVINSDNYIIAYSSLASTVVKEKDNIAAGRPIGSMGITVLEPEPHLHLSIQQQPAKEYCNPSEIFPGIAK